MEQHDMVEELKKEGILPREVSEPDGEEIYIRVEPEDFVKAALFTHKKLRSPVMSMFATDERAEKGMFKIFCVFLDAKRAKWVTLIVDATCENAGFPSLARAIFSAGLFERDIYEMFGIEPLGNPDKRRLLLHDEVWPQGSYPLRKDFVPAVEGNKHLGDFVFQRIEGDGVFELPVGPVHAGIIGPGHFRFSSAGEPIVNLEIRLGFTHRGVEKTFETRAPLDSVPLAECVAGDSAFGHSLAFAGAVEKICVADVPARALYERAVCLELERMYNHFSGIGGMAVDVSFSFPAQFASVMKERILRLNEKLTGHRYLKNFNIPGGVREAFTGENIDMMLKELSSVMRDFQELKKMLYGSVSFMDRADDTGVLRKKTAEDLGVVGLAGRASGSALDMREIFRGEYKEAGFTPARCEKGDVSARLKVRLDETEESYRLIRYFADKIKLAEGPVSVPVSVKDGSAFGTTEAWRGPVLYWVRISGGKIDRCKIVDASFHNWQGLSFAVLGNIIPDFPLCNKSFDLSYAGNDL